MITEKEWIDFLSKQYKSLNIDEEGDMTAFVALAAVEEFLRIKGEIR